MRGNAYFNVSCSKHLIDCEVCGDNSDMAVSVVAEEQGVDIALCWSCFNTGLQGVLPDDSEEQDVEAEEDST